MGNLFSVFLGNYISVHTLTKSTNNIILEDSPGIHQSPYYIYPSGDVWNVQLDFLVTVYDKKKAKNANITHPLSIMPLGTFEWSMHETRVTK